MKKIYALALMLVMVVFTACSSSAEEANTQENNLVLKENQILNIEKISVKGKIYDAKSAESKPNINFGVDKIYGLAGCNRFFGAYQKNSKGISIEEGSIASTQMLCHPTDIMEFEHMFLSNFKGDFELSYENDKPVLENETMKIFFE